MDKAQALYEFWSGFDIPAYDENSIPYDNTRPELPYITYETSTDSIGNQLPLSASIWYRSTSWVEVTQKADEVAAAIGYGHKIIPLNDGYLFIVKGTPFARRMNDENDIMIKRIIINITVEFLTAN